jgi:hypothetical protein
MAHDIFLIVLGWAIPLFLAWLLAKIPFVQQKLSANQVAKSVAIRAESDQTASALIRWRCSQRTGAGGLDSRCSDCALAA